MHALPPALSVHEARKSIALELVDLGLAIPMIEGAGVDVRGGNRRCFRVSARRVGCEWKIEAFRCDDTFASCDPEPYLESHGTASAELDGRKVVVDLNNDSALRRGNH